MTASDASLSIAYQVALSGYLAHPNEETLQQAYELGRGAMNAGLGILDLVRLHHRALVKGAWSVDRPAATVHWVPIIETFLLAALSSFEAAYRDFRRTRERSQELNEALGERNEAFALSNAQLEEEISVRKKTEADLRESKDHYFQLFQQARAMEENLRELSSRVLTAQEEERRRISRELHDEIGQALTAVNVAIALLKRQARSDSDFQRKVSEAEQLLAQSMEKVRCFARELRPAMLDHLGVQSALRSHLASFSQHTGIRTELVAHPSLGRIDSLRGEVLFRVAQEALNNVFKHAKATAAKIVFSVTGDSLAMEIADNGSAFCVEETLAGKRSGRLGLLGMQERVRLVDGTFAIESAPGRGTRIRVQLPLRVQTPPTVPV